MEWSNCTVIFLHSSTPYAIIFRVKLLLYPETLSSNQEQKSKHDMTSEVLAAEMKYSPSCSQLKNVRFQKKFGTPRKVVSTCWRRGYVAWSVLASQSRHAKQRRFFHFAVCLFLQRTKENFSFQRKQLQSSWSDAAAGCPGSWTVLLETLGGWWNVFGRLWVTLRSHTPHTLKMADLLYIGIFQMSITFENVYAYYEGYHGGDTRHVGLCLWAVRVS